MVTASSSLCVTIEIEDLEPAVARSIADAAAMLSGPTGAGTAIIFAQMVARMTPHQVTVRTVVRGQAQSQEVRHGD